MKYSLTEKGVFVSNYLNTFPTIYVMCIPAVVIWLQNLFTWEGGVGKIDSHEVETSSDCNFCEFL
jgi:hypothetical protein